MLLYIHGFLSSSQSVKAQQLKRWLAAQGREKEWCCPDLPPNPTLAMQLLREKVMVTEQPIKLIGSSLGGFYATALSEEFNLRTVLVNPAINPGRLLREKIGTYKAWHSSDDVIFTQADVDALNAMYVETVKNPDNFFMMVEKGDETLDYRQAITYYKDCNQLIFNHGDHSFSRFEQVLPLIDQF